MSENKLQLKVGHYYRRRDGEIVGPITRAHRAYGLEYPYTTDDKVYTADGYRWKAACKPETDLIEDLGPVDPRTVEPKLQLKSGNYYKRRDGKIVGPVTFRGFGFEFYPYLVGGETYTSSGKYASNSNDKNEFDLIEDLGPIDPRTATKLKEQPNLGGATDTKSSVEVGSSPTGCTKPPKRPLSVGDRVVAYMYPLKEKAKVHTIHSKDNTVILTDKGDYYSVHPKQCRRLVKKQKVTNVFSGKTDAEIAEQIKMSMRINGLCGPESLAGNAFLKHLGLGE